MKVKIISLIACLLFFAISLVFKSSACFAEELITYSRLTNGFWQVWVAASDGTSARQLTKGDFDKRYPALLPDVPGGRALIYRTNDGRLFKIKLDGRKEHRILDKFDNIANFDICLSGNKKSIVFTRYRTDLRDDCDIWTANPDGSNFRMLTNDIGLQYSPSWSPGLKEIAFVSGGKYGTHEICIMDADGKNRSELTHNDAYDISPSFSPDGRRIAFVSDRTGDYEIWVMDKNGKNQKQLTDSEGLDSSPVWSPKEDKIIFVSNRAGGLQLWMMDSDGRNQRRITQGRSECRDPDWGGSN